MSRVLFMAALGLFASIALFPIGRETLAQAEGEGAETAPASPMAQVSKTASQLRRERQRAAARARAQERARARARAREAYRRRMAAYRRMRSRWHQKAPPGIVRRWQRQSPRPLELLPTQHRGRYLLIPESEEGGFDAGSMLAVRKAFTYRDGTSHDVHPRLVELMYRAALEFNAPYIHIISGYRSTARPTSRHHQGRAVDMVLPGVSNGRLARFLRRQGFVGVGTYAVSGFVHLDVRERSYFWSDASGPGRRPRPRTVYRAETYRYDSGARARGEEAVPDLVIDGVVTPGGAGE